MQKSFIYFQLILLSLFFQINAGTSIFGLAPGSLGTVNINGSTSAIGRGGFEIAYFDTLSLNNANYAQWPLLTQTTINLNMSYNRIATETNSQSAVSSSGNFNGGHLAIPVINKKLVFGVALLPTISSDQSISVENLGISTNVVETLKSTGNISEGSFITSYAFSDAFSVAGVLSYNFGLIEDKITLDYDSQGYLDIILYNKYKLYGSSFALHSFFKINDYLYSGLSLKFPAKLTMKTEQNSVNSNEYVKDSRKIDLPLRTSFGMAYLFENQYILGLDFDYQTWKNGYKIDGVVQESFSNNYRIALGIEKMPSGRRFVPYPEKMYYRGGIYFGQINMLSNNNNVIEYGIGIGVGLPILSPSDRIDLALQYGKRGDLSKNLASENIFKFNISVTASSLWFVREDN